MCEHVETNQILMAMVLVLIKQRKLCHFNEVASLTVDFGCSLEKYGN